MRQIYIILTGEIRDERRFQQNINIFNRLLSEEKIKGVVVSTNRDVHPNFMKPKNFTYIETPNLKDNGYGNWRVQMTQFRDGLNHILGISDNGNTFVLKSRPDVVITYDFLLKVFAKELKVGGENHGMRYKVWIPWAEISKPFYFGDECFFGHIYDVRKMYNFNEIYQHDKLGQGVAHIRRYINHFLHVPILKEYVNNKHNINVYLLTINDFQKLKKLGKDEEVYDYYVKLVATYYKILNDCFDIETEPDSITFREWSNYPPEKCVNPEESLQQNNKRLCTSAQKMICFGKEVLVGRLKIMYNNKWLENLFDDKFDESEL